MIDNRIKWIVQAVAICVGTVTCGGLSAEDAGTDGSQVGAVSSTAQELRDFSLQDFRGKRYRLEDFQDRPVLVLAFLGTECPLAKLYGRRLQAVAEEYDPRGVQVVGVFSNQQDSVTELGTFSRQHQLTFPILKDVGNRLADQCQAARTPQVFVFDSKRQRVYSGRVDDQYGIGYVREEPTRHDLRLALDAVLADRPIEQPVTSPVGCIIGRVRQPDEASEVTYAADIAPILNRRCVECHREGEIAPFALTDYDEVAGWAEMIAEVTEQRRMPPWHAAEGHLEFANSRHLSDEELRLIRTWVDNGAPLGDANQIPQIPEFVTGWQLPRQPDLVVGMQDEPYEVASEGAVEYQYFHVDPKLSEDRWLSGIEVQPGNRAVVHHILVFAEPPQGEPGDDFAGGARGFLGGYVPGMRAEVFAPGMAKFLAAGSKLVFQLHYTPIGSKQLDLSRIGFVFADPEAVRYEVKTVSAFQPGIRIPKRMGNHAEKTKTRIPQDALLLSFSPHMHLRGKAFRYELFDAEQQAWKTLLDVPEYDFNWQTRYILAQPLRLAAGSYIRCEGWFDNSAENPNNPNPDQVVTWGEQTWDEMLIGYFDVAFPLNNDQSNLVRLDGKTRAEEFILQRDKNDDFRLQADELPLRMRLMAMTADADRDGVISTEELMNAFRRRASARPVTGLASVRLARDSAKLGHYRLMGSWHNSGYAALTRIAQIAVITTIRGKKLAGSGTNAVASTGPRSNPPSASAPTRS